jgi:hypothetical protein
MKNLLQDIKFVGGVKVKGIVKVELIPIELITFFPAIDYSTGAYINPIQFKNNYSNDIFSVDFVPGSKKLMEKPKTNKDGTYIEVSIKGINADIVQNTNRKDYLTLANAKYKEFIVIVYLRGGIKKIIGTDEIGCKLLATLETENSQGGSEENSFDITYSSLDYIPFYNV